MAGKQEIVKTTLRVPRELLDRAKIQAVKDHTSLQDVIVKALQAYVKGGRS